MTSKYCPFQSSERADVKCSKELCRLWVELEKPLPHPNKKLVYRGCGLITHVPWKIEEIKDEPTTA